MQYLFQFWCWLGMCVGAWKASTGIWCESHRAVYIPSAMEYRGTKRQTWSNCTMISKFNTLLILQANEIKGFFTETNGGVNRMLLACSFETGERFDYSDFAQSFEQNFSQSQLSLSFQSFVIQMETWLTWIHQALFLLSLFWRALDRWDLVVKSAYYIVDHIWHCHVVLPLFIYVHRLGRKAAVPHTVNHTLWYAIQISNQDSMWLRHSCLSLESCVRALDSSCRVHEITA